MMLAEDRPQVKFAPGDRVVALKDTIWDEREDTDFSLPEWDYLRLYGHYGKVVDDSECPDGDIGLVHVRWQGTYDGRPPESTSWTVDGHIWHMQPYELEHID